MEIVTPPDPLPGRRAEILRQTSVALQGRPVTLWEVSADAVVVSVLTSAAPDAARDRPLGIDQMLHHWGAPIIQGSRWVGCRLNGDQRWCVAPVRKQPAGPPPGGIERRSRERITLELAGLCLGLVDQSPDALRPRLADPAAMAEWIRQPSVIAHEVANPLTAAMAGLDLALDRLRVTPGLNAAFRGDLLEDLTGVGEAMDQAIVFLRAVQDRARGRLARSERFDAAPVVRSCVALERPLARKMGVALQGIVAASSIFLLGDPNALYQILTNLIRNAVAASHDRKAPVIVTLEQSGETLRLTVQDQGTGILAEHIERIFEQGFTTQEFGSGSGTGLIVVRHIVQEMFGGAVEVESVAGYGSTFRVSLPIPPQRPRDVR
jgi:hypothetical protein